MPRIGAVAVDDGRDFAGTAGAARTALTELGARLSGQADLGHSRTPRADETTGSGNDENPKPRGLERCGASALPPGERDAVIPREQRRGARVNERHRVDHGGSSRALPRRATPSHYPSGRRAIDPYSTP